MMGMDFIRTFVDTATTMGSRSSILKPLQWLIGILGSTTLGAAYVQAPIALIWTLGISTIAVAAFMVGAFIWFGVKNPDALRSETYSLSKMAIERGYTGDSTVGLRPARSRRTALPTQSRQQLSPGGEQ